MPSENMLQSEAFWLVLGVIVGELGAQMMAAPKHTSWPAPCAHHPVKVN